eukprot:gnl/Dysnectes_brevis/2957_a3636_1616.p1 GENE.gnl/Dysnectes_brevis/2957_a3636_1616~~gnl/Dysnectes_brevis/2957_a3636_1616.p1  ORF type:complete len:254 (+),score=6.31 gnl/Dysnectes_brevis/2957_a3636_1616:57-818(+)
MAENPYYSQLPILDTMVVSKTALVNLFLDHAEFDPTQETIAFLSRAIANKVTSLIRKAVYIAQTEHPAEPLPENEDRDQLIQSHISSFFESDAIFAKLTRIYQDEAGRLQAQKAESTQQPTTTAQPSQIDISLRNFTGAIRMTKSTIQQVVQSTPYLLARPVTRSHVLMALESPRLVAMLRMHCNPHTTGDTDVDQQVESNAPLLNSIDVLHPIITEEGQKLMVVHPPPYLQLLYATYCNFISKPKETASSTW